MSKFIKTKSSKRDIKVIDKSKIAAGKLRQTAKDKMRSEDAGEADDLASPEGYAESKMRDSADGAARSISEGVSENVRRLTAHRTKKRDAAKEPGNARGSGDPNSSSRRFNNPRSADNPVKTERMKDRTRNFNEPDRSVIGNANVPETPLQDSAPVSPDMRSALKPPRKENPGAKMKAASIRSRPKTVNRTSQKSVKTYQAETMHYAAGHRRKAVTAKAKRQTARKAQAAAKKAAVFASKTVRAIIAAMRSLITILASWGSVALIAIILIIMIAAAIGSSFGIFFSGEDNGTGMTIRTAMEEINTEYQNKLADIKKDNPHDKVEISGARAVWKDVLAVYAVKTATDRDNPLEVATVTEEKIEILRSIFWEMNSISSKVKTVTKTVIETTDDGEGNIIEEEVEVTEKILYIKVTHKTADEMAAAYLFGTDQKVQLAELLSKANDDLWVSVLYGVSSGNGDIVEVALSQVGNVGGQPYWSWYGFGSRVSWCATFVSWCANECGYIESGVIPKFAQCQVQGIAWFKERGQWQPAGYEPKPGELIFFDWQGDGHSDHVGIVEKCENGIVYTIEGNSSDAVRKRQYSISSSSICGYGIPQF